ncbi:MAG: hypothetical protein H6744_12115 [Deltaproteobacteria bacterium]|nr:hypothetical protein [Deltaproteobacteria bacterium]MCB9787416.1 hypothetical protein [Deltaproteobacteria bacterium]
MAHFDHDARGLPPHVRLRRRRAARALGVFVLTLLGLGLIVGRCAVERHAATAAAERGAAALLRAVEGDPSAWPEVDAAYGEAARSGAMGADPYALFVLELTRRLRAGEVPIEDPAARAVVTAMAADDLESARGGLEAVSEPLAKAWLSRLLGEIDRAREKRSATPGPDAVIGESATER